MIFIKTEFGTVYANKSTINIGKEKKVEGIVIYDVDDNEICKVPFITISQLSKMPIYVENLIENFCA